MADALHEGQLSNEVIVDLSSTLAPSQDSPQQSLHCVQSGRDAGRGGPRSVCVHGGTHFMGEDPAQKRIRNDEEGRRLPTGGSGERFAAACASKKQAKEGDREGNGLCLQDSQSTSSRSRLSKMTVLDHSEVSVSGACEGGAGASSMTATRVVPESISERTTRPSCPL